VLQNGTLHCNCAKKDCIICLYQNPTSLQFVFKAFFIQSILLITFLIHNLYFAKHLHYKIIHLLKNASIRRSNFFYSFDRVFPSHFVIQTKNQYYLKLLLFS